MAAHFKKAYFSQETVEKASQFCSNLETDLNGLYSTAWCYTKTLYTCSSDVISSLVQLSGQENVVQASRVSATFVKHMTIKEAYYSLRIDESEIVDNDGLTSYLDHGNDFDDRGTSIWIGDIRSLQTEVSHVPVGKLPQLFVVINGTQMKLGYTPHLVPAYSPEAFLDTFVKVVTQFVGQPYDTCLLDLDVLGPYNRTILDRWMASDLVLIERCIHHYVDEHAMKTPEKEAVVSTEGPNFTYAQLSRLSDKLAVHLASLGIRKGDIVPILFEKSSIAVLAVMSIMKTGGAYVGFAAESPINFLRECAAIADASLIITSRQNKSLVRRLGRCPLVIDLEFLASLENCLDQNGFESPAQPSDLAYLVFTSGSTGVPKAVMTEHAAYVTDALAQQDAALLNSSTRLFHFASYNFDATNFDILSTLIAGATICVPSEYNRINHLAAEINTLGANFLELTATVAQILDPQEVPGLEVVILCGEANSPEVVEKWVSAGLDVINGYGPSEAACAFSYNIYTRQHPQANNIGRALKNACQGHVVNPDNHNQLLPVGALGELVIRGPTLGRGYLNEPEKTAAVYIANPSWLHKSAQREFGRVYKTGDLVRQLPDQSFEIHGRIDKQVKLNGQRIELGDIEHKVGRLLRDYQSVAVEVLKLPWQKGSQTWLCAFYARTVGNYSFAQATGLIDMESATMNISRIKSLLAEDLKSIAIPQAFIPLQSMPVTTQGKLDRKTLQKLSDQLDSVNWAKFSGSKVAEDHVKDNFERRVQSLYAQVLNLSAEAIFRDSDFTELGGDSAKAIKFVSLAKKAGLNASVPDILRYPKLQDLCMVLRDQKQDFEERVYVPFDAIKDRQDLEEIRSKAAQYMNINDIEDIIQATDLQDSCVAFSTFVSRHSGVNWLLCDFATPYPEEKVQSLCEAWTSRHAIFRTAFMAHRGVLYQIVSRSFRPPIRSHLRLSNIHDSTKKLMEDDKRRPVEMTEPQTAFELLSQGDKIERLVIRLSAAQYDGHSVAILGEEARTLLSGDQKLKDMEGSYSAYLYHSRALQSAQAVEYWRHLLSGAKPTQIAAQSGIPTFQDFVDGVLARTVETRLLDLDRSSLPNHSRKEALTISTRATVVKTAWALALAELTGQDDILFGATAWGRNAPVPFAHDVVGSCSSHIPVRARVGMFDTYAGLLGNLQAQHVESMRFEMLGANTIVRHCTDWPRWARLSSLLVFQGLDIHGEGQNEEEKNSAGAAVPPAEATAANIKFTEIMDPGDRADVILHVEPFGQKTRVLMAFSKRRVPDTTAQAMMDAFERHLGLVSQCATGFIRPRGLTSSLLFTVEPQLGETYDEKTRVFENLGAAQEIVRSAWMNILGADAIEFEKCKATQKEFLEIWGNPVSAAGIARHYKETGLQVTTEEVLECSSVEDQIRLVSRKIKDFQQ